MERERFSILFEGLTDAEANRAATGLREALLDLHSDATVEIAKDSGSRTQDFGSTVILALGAPAAVAVAGGIAAWLRRSACPSVLIVDVDGNRVVASGSATGALDAVAIAKVLRRDRKK